MNANTKAYFKPANAAENYACQSALELLKLHRAGYRAEWSCLGGADFAGLERRVLALRDIPILPGARREPTIKGTRSDMFM